ncbi:hypothetical protein SAMN05216349_10315 [Oribacterium sp. KHPX15]|uniref:hypothetical protein n=1 Tax=Oribacterium sp. KHPX15 TaxID=1855342 RepID=UPI000898FA2D|nr:hypothetical protein [Oribacterium sp. KHPX15]SDZ95447.1 hypothetical protein SAMN05216349_10315 [Oribacterium sp. KHPX15]
MGLFNFLKPRKPYTDNENVTDDQEQNQTGAFKGDLAYFSEYSNSTGTVYQNTESGKNSGETYGIDSEDSEVYMTFENHAESFWNCPECGTHNDLQMTGCVVCGLKK